VRSRMQDSPDPLRDAPPRMLLLRKCARRDLCQ
jgi:hypothetical protein